MANMLDYAMRERYERLAKLGGKIAELEGLVDWEVFRPIVTGLFDNRILKGLGASALATAKFLCFTSFVSALMASM